MWRFVEDDIDGLQKNLLRHLGVSREPTIHFRLAGAELPSELAVAADDLQRSEEDLVPWRAHNRNQIDRNQIENRQFYGSRLEFQVGGIGERHASAACKPKRWLLR
jgi:hypothetical protein